MPRAPPWRCSPWLLRLSRPTPTVIIIQRRSRCRPPMLRTIIMPRRPPVRPTFIPDITQKSIPPRPVPLTGDTNIPSARSCLTRMSVTPRFARLPRFIITRSSAAGGDKRSVDIQSFGRFNLPGRVCRVVRAPRGLPPRKGGRPRNRRDSAATVVSAQAPSEIAIPDQDAA